MHIKEINNAVIVVAVKLVVSIYYFDLILTIVDSIRAKPQACKESCRQSGVVSDQEFVIRIQ